MSNSYEESDAQKRFQETEAYFDQSAFDHEKQDEERDTHSATDKPSPASSDRLLEEDKDDVKDDEADSTESSKRSYKKLVDKATVQFPTPSWFGNRKNKDGSINVNFKPETLPDNTCLLVEIQALEADAATRLSQQVHELVGKYASNKRWPTKKLQDIFYRRKLEQTRYKEMKKAFKEHAAKIKSDALKRKQQHVEMQDQSMKDLDDALRLKFQSVLCDGMLSASKNNTVQVSADDKNKIYGDALEAAKTVFTEWAPKIKKFPASLFNRALQVAAQNLITDDIARKIIDDLPSDESNQTKNVVSKKRKASAPEDDDGEDKIPPSQKEAYRIAKKPVGRTPQ